MTPITSSLTREEWAERLGVPPERVRMTPEPGTATVDDARRVNEAKGGALCELVDGVLVEKPMGLPESRVGGQVFGRLFVFLMTHPIGEIFPADGMMRIGPGQVRMPDVSFVGNERLKNGRLPRGQVPELVPHLAVEVLSPSNTRREIERKLKDYFFAGVVLVWVIDPEGRDARVYTSPDAVTHVPADGSLDGGNVLPGFALPLSPLFDALPNDEEDAA